VRQIFGWGAIALGCAVVFVLWQSVGNASESSAMLGLAIVVTIAGAVAEWYRRRI
jgi:hypothetical protein